MAVYQYGVPSQRDRPSRMRKLMVLMGILPVVYGMNYASGQSIDKFELR